VSVGLTPPRPAPRSQSSQVLALTTAR
jgi:hypothetical protein